MSNIEIHIWANPSGFRELAPNFIPSQLLSKDDKIVFSPDVYDDLKFGELFSFFYAKDAYVISYHYFTKKGRWSRESDFRDYRTIVSIAVRRGFILNEAYNVLCQLKDNYEEMLDKLSNINSIDALVSQQVGIWSNQIELSCVQQLDQPVLNLFGSAKGKGIVPFKSNEDLKTYLQYPMRPEFKNAQIVFFAKDIEISTSIATIKNLGISGLTNVTPVYMPTFDVYFPAYNNNQPIATITSLNDVIYKECELQNYKKIVLQGSLNEKVAEWSITQSPDKLSYNIGLKFEPITETLKLILQTKDGLPYYNYSKIRPSIGRIVQDCLVLSGDEIGKPVTFSPEDSNLKIVASKIPEGYRIVLDEVVSYDMVKLCRTIFNRYGFEPRVSIMVDNKICQIPNNQPFTYSKFREDSIFILIEQSEHYQAKKFPLNTDVLTVQLSKKQRVELVVEYSETLKKWLQKKDGRSILVEEIDVKSGDIKGEGYRIDVNNNKILVPADKNEFLLSFSADGFKKHEESVNIKNSIIISLSLKKTGATRITEFIFWLLPKLVVPILCLIAGMFIGWQLLCPSTSHNPKLQCFNWKNVNVTNDTVEITVHDTIKVAIHDTIYIDKGSSEGTKKDPSNSVGERCTWKFSEKLNGIDFTFDDYEADRKKAFKISGMIKANLKYFEARKNVFIYLKGQKKADNLKKFIKDYGSYMTKVQKDALIKISESDLYESEERDYKTIQDLLTALGL